MTVKANLTRWFSKLGEIHFDQPREKFTRQNPIFLVPKQWADEFPYAEVRAWLYNRYNGAETLRIDMTLPFVVDLTPHDVVRLSRQIHDEIGPMPYGELRFHMADDNKVQIMITHSLHAADVSAEGLAQVIDGMVFVTDYTEGAVVDFEPGGSKSTTPQGKATKESVKTPTKNPSPERDEEQDSFDGLLAEVHQVKRDETLESVLADLENMVGLGTVKTMVRRLVSQQRIGKKREAAGLKAQVPSPHLIFTGNPGTGKTTIARQIGKIYKLLGLLEKGHVIEADRATLVAPYVGQTALKTKEVCEKALDGVLFIDEAYSLDGGHHRDYGSEAIEALMTFMENNRGRFVVVVAGYEGLMNNFIDANPGLASRFDVTIDFPDYSNAELRMILEGLVRENSYHFAAEAADAAHELIRSWTRGHGFGNGRTVRKLFNEIIANQALLLDGLSNVGEEDLQLIPVEAVPIPEVISIGSSTKENVPHYMGYL